MQEKNIETDGGGGDYDDNNIRNRRPHITYQQQQKQQSQHQHHNVVNIIPAATKAPKETLIAIYSAGKYKANLRLNVLTIQSFMAGIYIASAGQLYLTVGGGVLGAVLFPYGLIAVILTSAELFTGDALIFVASVLGGQVQLKSLIRNWTVSWLSNFLGCVSWALVMAYLSNALVDVGAQELAIKVAEKKALNVMYSIFIKGIGANFSKFIPFDWYILFFSYCSYSYLTNYVFCLVISKVVCVAVWQGTCATEVAGKVLALWYPTAAFVIMGFDHVVANMF